MTTDGAMRKILDAVAGCDARARRVGLLACMAASVIALAPAPAAAANASLTVSPITGSASSYLVTVTNTGKVELTGFEFAAGPPEAASPPKQLVPSSACAFHGLIACNVNLQPGASFQVCYEGAEVSLFEGVLLARLKPAGEIFGNGAGTNYGRPPVSACPLPGFTNSSSGGGAAGKCKVPTVLDKAQASAEKAIRNAGCRVGKVKKQRSSHVKKGHVISQAVSAGKSVAAGTRIALVVSRGK